MRVPRGRAGGGVGLRRRRTFGRPDDSIPTHGCSCSEDLRSQGAPERLDTRSARWRPWVDESFKFEIPAGARFNAIVVPTMDTVRHECLIEQLLLNGFHVMCTGETGTGKTTVARIFGELLYAIGARRSDQFVELKAQQAMSMGVEAAPVVRSS